MRFNIHDQKIDLKIVQSHATWQGTSDLARILSNIGLPLPRVSSVA